MNILTPFLTPGKSGLQCQPLIIPFGISMKALTLDSCLVQVERLEGFESRNYLTMKNLENQN